MLPFSSGIRSSETNKRCGITVNLNGIDARNIGQRKEKYSGAKSFFCLNVIWQRVWVWVYAAIKLIKFRSIIKKLGTEFWDE